MTLECSAVAKDFATCLPRDEKRCCDCEQSKPLTEFHVNTHSPDGRQYICKACRTVFDSRRRTRNRPVASRTIANLFRQWKPVVIVTLENSSG